jgi:hypothetical protein
MGVAHRAGIHKEVLVQHYAGIRMETGGVVVD